MTPSLSATVLIPLIVAAVAILIVARWYELRRLDDPFVAAFWWFTGFWIVGAGLNSFFPKAPPVSGFALALLFAAYVAFVAAGILVAWRVRPRLGPAWAERYAQLAPVELLDQRRLILLGATLVAGLAAFALLRLAMGGTPDVGSGVEQGRIDSRAGLGTLVLGSIWLLTIPGLAIFADAMRRGRTHQAAAVVLLLAVGLLVAVIGSRGPVAKLLLGAVFLAFAARGRLPRWSILVAIGAAGVLALGATAALRSDWGFSADGALFRLFWQLHVNTTNLARLVDFIPGTHPYLLGGSYVTDLSVVLPGPSLNFGAWLKEALGLEFSGGGLTVGLVGESYANFGPIVAVASCALAGGLLPLVRGYLRIRDGLDIAVATLLAIALAGIVQTGIASVLLYNVIPLLAVYLVLRTVDARWPSRYGGAVRA